MEKESDIDMLARMMIDGFKSMDTRFDRLEDRMDGLEGRTEHLEGRFSSLEGRMETLEKEVRITNQRIDQVIIPTIDEHAHRIKTLEQELL